MSGNRLEPGLLAAGLQVFVDGGLAADEVGHFGPHLFQRDRLPLFFVFQLGNLEAAGDEFALGGFGLFDLEQEHLFLRVLAGVDQNLLEFGRQLFKDAFADDQRLEVVGIMDFGQIPLVGFVELHGAEADVAVALAVHVAGLEGVEGLGPRDEGGDGAEGLVGGDHDRALRHAEAQALHVFQLGDRVLVVGHEAEARIGPGQDAETGLGGVRVQQFGGSAVGAGHDFVQVVEQIGQRQDAELLFEGHDVGDAAEGHVEGALLDLAEAFAFVVARRAAVDADDLDGAVGLFFDILLERVADDAHFGAFGVAHGDFQRRGRDRRGCGSRGPQAEGRQEHGDKLLAAHDVLFF